MTLSKSKLNQSLRLLGLLALTLNLNWTSGCGGGGDSVSVQPSSDEFKQVGTADIKIDILFMIDDSGSMAPGQAAMSDNLGQFIELFDDKGFDYRVAIGKTSEYLKSSPNFFAASHGHRILQNGQSYDLIDAFQETVVAVGVAGSGSEQSFESTKDILNARASADNFPRAGAHLAVIYLGDENDVSPDSVQTYYDHLIGVVNAAQDSSSIGSLSTHAIEVTGESDCKANTGHYGGSSSYGVIHSAASAGTKQYAMADLTEGKKLSICENFGVTLADIADDIAHRAAVFYLDRTDIIADTVQVFVNDEEVSESASNGFTYEVSPPRIVFHGDAIPEQDAHIKVTYTTEGL